MIKAKEKTFVPLTNDLLFKEVMAHPDNREALIDFIKTVTGIKESVIRSNLVVEYESVLDKTRLNDKNLRGDVIVKFSDYYINLENYSTFDKSSLQKSVSYVMRIYSTQLDRGQKYEEMKKIIQINVIENNETDSFHNFENSIYLTGAFTGEKILSEEFCIMVYNLDKIKHKPYNELDDLERWMLFVGAKDAKTRTEIASGNEILERLDKFVEMYINDERTKELYGKWGEYIALEKGKKFGLKEGKIKGKKEEKLNTAKVMLKDNLPIDKISKYTGLTEEEIKKL